MTVSRRQFVQRCSAAAALGAVAGRSAWSMVPLDVVEHDLRRQAQLADADTVRRITMAAVDAAKQAGATYADARVTRTVKQGIVMMDTVRQTTLRDVEEHALGVRALIDGQWGFASSAVWTTDEAARLAKDAVAQARIKMALGARPVDWGNYPVVTGSWTMPIGIDPFAVPFEERIDFLDGWMEALRHVGRNLATMHGHGVSAVRQERAIGTTEGSYFTQTIYEVSARLGTSMMPLSMTGDRDVRIEARGLGRQGGGWDALLAAKPIEQIPALLDEGYEKLSAPIKPAENGRYEVVLDAESAATLLGRSIGVATELDRALGYEANATGTSYLGPKPLDLLGTFQVATSQLTVTANRSARGGLATVKWDDEGVEPDEFTIVKNGVLNDYQTTREQAAWLTPWYTKSGHSVRSHGCAGAESALFATTQCPPNVAIVPSSGKVGVHDLIANVKKGVFFESWKFDMDFQLRNGYGYGNAREIVNGKLGAVLTEASTQFSSLDVWKNVTVMGGAADVAMVGLTRDKGEPNQESNYSASAPPMTIANLMLINREGHL